MNGTRRCDKQGGTQVATVAAQDGSEKAARSDRPVGALRAALRRAAILARQCRADGAAAALGFLNATELSVVHGFMPLARDMMGYAGVEAQKIEEQVAHAGQDARKALVAFVGACCPTLLQVPLVVEEGPASEVIRRAVERLDAELVVIGTRGYTGLKRLLLGGVAEEILRNIECDVLAVPPKAVSGKA